MVLPERLARAASTTSFRVAAITVEGRLVDYAMYQRAKRVLELAKLDR